MRHSPSALLASILSTFIIAACSQGGSPLGVSEEEGNPVTRNDSAGLAKARLDSASGNVAAVAGAAKDSAIAADPVTAPAVAADPVPAIGTAAASDTAAASPTVASTPTPAVDAPKPMSVVDSILAAGAKPQGSPAVDPGTPAIDSGSGPAAPVAGGTPADAAPSNPAVPALDAPVVAVPTVIPPIPAAGPNVLLSTDLEDQSLDCWNGGSARSAGCGVFKSMGAKPFSLSESGIAHSGRKAIDITYAKNEEAGGANVGINTDSVNVRAWYYFEPGFDFGQGMKIGRVSSFNTAKQMNDVDIILEVRSAKGDQCGVTDMRDVGLFFNGAPKGSDWGNVAATTSFQRGRWYALEYQVVLNSPGKSDGAVRLWVDGVQVAARQNLTIRGSLGADAKLNTVKIGGWYSNGANGNSACANPSQPAKLHMDDVVIAKSYIGMGQPALAGNP
ncbi:MAG: hypothetical protein JWO30_3898 [Fibrobacteres bacterium]|nr:hypothetical protein [Fibrobacterota bacterium]